MRDAETKICIRCQEVICDTCRFDGSDLCSNCNANICDTCLKGGKKYE
jgi:hypothetical protein